MLDDSSLSDIHHPSLGMGEHKGWYTFYHNSRNKQNSEVNLRSAEIYYLKFENGILFRSVYSVTIRTFLKGHGKSSSAAMRAYIFCHVEPPVLQRTYTKNVDLKTDKKPTKKQSQKRKPLFLRFSK